MSNKQNYSRREFLKIVGVGGGLVAAGCSSELPEKIVPYVIQPDETIPGVATWYSGTCAECAAHCGVMARVREGRVVKLEGLPKHPISQGALCARGQSALQGLYDPDRLREPLRRQNGGGLQAISWADAIKVFAQAVKEVPSGKSVVFLSPPPSASMATLLNGLVNEIPQARFCSYDPFGNEYLVSAAEKVFGERLILKPEFAEADVIVSIGAGFLETWWSPVEFSKAWVSKRRPAPGGRGLTASFASEMSFFVQVEPRLSLTGANADLWVKNRPGSERSLLRLLLSEIGKRKGISSESLKAGTSVSEKNRVGGTQGVVELSDAQKAQCLLDVDIPEETISRIVEALITADRPLVVVGNQISGGAQLEQCAVLSHLLNYHLGAIGETLSVWPEVQASGGDGVAEKVGADKNAPNRNLHERCYSGIPELIKDMSQGKVGVIVIVDVDPRYQLPNLSGFESALSKVPQLVTVASNNNETVNLSNLILAKSHSLESWWDSEPSPGLFNINQPAMQPVFQTQSIGDILLALARSLDLKKVHQDALTYHDYLQKRWKERLGATGFKDQWESCLARGWDDSSYASIVKRTVFLRGSFDPDSFLTESEKTGVVPSGSKMEHGLIIQAFPTVMNTDGTQANRPWMQEIPDPITSVVWGSWVEMHPQRAAEIGIKDGAQVRLQTKGGSVDVPVLIREHLHRDLLAMPIGQGHTRLGRYAAGVGANVLRVMPGELVSGSIQCVAEVESIAAVSGGDELVRTRQGTTQGKRDLLRVHDVGSQDSTLHSHLEDPHEKSEGHAEGHTLKQMYTQMDHPLYRWGMVIDLAACTGCSACVVACYAENNVPVVGKALAREGREMSWIRLDSYLDGPENSPIQGFQPMMCQHCDNAPCEPVCPVYATYHNEQGLNTMVYNRCVGTRYCSNNCPYKVRRFNWFRYSWPEPLTMQLNPDVTVREVGIMEKCTFCVQRIREATNNSKNQGRQVVDGEVQPACASSCPTEAIVFGNLLDRNSSVARLRKDMRAYKVLDKHVNTQPAITYLERLRKG